MQFPRLVLSYSVMFCLSKTKVFFISNRSKTFDSVPTGRHLWSIWMSAVVCGNYEENKKQLKSFKQVVQFRINACTKWSNLH